MDANERHEAISNVVNDLTANRPNEAMEILQGLDLVREKCVELFQGGHGTVTIPQYTTLSHRGDDIVFHYHVVKGENSAYRCDCEDYQGSGKCRHALAVEIYTLANLAD